ncbi:MAG TPA: single-stranded DNA-binding protein, partial [Propionicimonas sp.]|nr:single-stranded DNA-binding protein [Propionicimonas sp.]
VWRQAAEHVAESLTKGRRVIVQGRLRQRSYETREGEKRTVVELEVEEIGPALKYATAKVTRSSGGSGGSYNSGTPAAGGGSSWSNSNAGGGGQTERTGGADPWASAQSEEPPF